MNITFLVGNGFDLNLGLRTSYADFLSWYMQRPSNDPVISKFRSNLSETSSLWWSDAERAMGQYVGSYYPANLNDYYRVIRDFKIELARYLEEEEKKCSYSSKKTIAKKTRDFLVKFSTEIMPNHGATLHSCSQKPVYNFINFNYTKTLDNILSCTRDVYPDMFSCIDKQSRDSVIQNAVVHIHGTLNTVLIMGVDNEFQINTIDQLYEMRLFWTLVKNCTNEELGRPEPNLAKKIIQESDIIVFYGLSVGETDKMWWDMIKHWLQVDIRHQIVLFTRSKTQIYNSLMPEDVLVYVDNAQDTFLRKLGFQYGVDEYIHEKEQVFVVKDTNLLDFSVCKPEIVV